MPRSHGTRAAWIGQPTPTLITRHHCWRPAGRASRRPEAQSCDPLRADAVLSEVLIVKTEDRPQHLQRSPCGGRSQSRSPPPCRRAITSSTAAGKSARCCCQSAKRSTSSLGRCRMPCASTAWPPASANPYRPPARNPISANRRCVGAKVAHHQVADRLSRPSCGELAIPQLPGLRRPAPSWRETRPQGQRVDTPRAQAVSRLRRRCAAAGSARRNTGRAASHRLNPQNRRVRQRATSCHAQM